MDMLNNTSKDPYVDIVSLLTVDTRFNMNKRWTYQMKYDLTPGKLKLELQRIYVIKV